MRACLGWLFFYLVTLPAVLASVYPTQPIAKTKFSTGQLAMVTWRDDNHKPHLEDMGYMRIDLHAADLSYVLTLADRVAPITRSHSVFIPPTLHKNSSHYTLRFITKHPPLEIWTANFKIIPDNYLFPAGFALANATSNVTSSSTITSTPQQTPVSTVRADPLTTSPSLTHGNGETSASTKIDLETYRFRVLFVLWPALVGISMAL
ncbi:hypothetical protein Hypma_002854 [Hypsizygus marmoreus]|uniref:Ser-Thr-rich glycosyl-phosphatidyl-inositol-anchored membrane family-domain-containing protein n=1 Tax=Hypsizygus marmoreus TaxID=39966 RepID=A0A369J9T1_HYPMA|nr:hypothetical protein Hypma_002854 [Hypsizygus marmoreus]